MKTHRLINAAISLFVACAAAIATEERARTLPRVDVIYDEIMSTLDPETRATIDSNLSSVGTKTPMVRRIDSTNNALEWRDRLLEQRNKNLEGLPEEVRRQVEKTLLELEKRQMERRLEFKEMKRGQK